MHEGAGFTQSPRGGPACKNGAIWYQFRRRDFKTPPFGITLPERPCKTGFARFADLRFCKWGRVLEGGPAEKLIPNGRGFETGARKVIPNGGDFARMTARLARPQRPAPPRPLCASRDRPASATIATRLPPKTWALSAPALWWNRIRASCLYLLRRNPAPSLPRPSARRRRPPARSAARLPSVARLFSITHAAYGPCDPQARP